MVNIFLNCIIYSLIAEKFEKTVFILVYQKFHSSFKIEKVKAIFINTQGSLFNLFLLSKATFGIYKFLPFLFFLN